MKLHIATVSRTAGNDQGARLIGVFSSAGNAAAACEQFAGDAIEWKDFSTDGSWACVLGAQQHMYRIAPFVLDEARVPVLPAWTAPGWLI